MARPSLTFIGQKTLPIGTERLDFASYIGDVDEIAFSPALLYAIVLIGNLSDRIVFKLCPFWQFERGQRLLPFFIPLKLAIIDNNFDLNKRTLPAVMPPPTTPAVTQ